VFKGLVWLSAAVSYLTLEAIAGAAFPSYSYAYNFISDLGVPSRSPLAWLMNVGFCVQGSLFLVGALAFKARLFRALVGVNLLGNVLIALFHSGSATHVLGAVFAIVGGNAAVLAGSRILGGWHRRVSIGLGLFGLLSFALFVVDLKIGSWPIGIVERCSVYSITAWQLITGAALLSRRPTP
jgi:hypothetical membrane protein